MTKTEAVNTVTQMLKLEEIIDEMAGEK